MDLSAWIWFHRLELPAAKAHRLLREFGEPEAIRDASPATLKLAAADLHPDSRARLLKALDQTDVSKEIQTLERLGAVAIPYSSPAYPAPLKNLPDPPVMLYAMGNLVPEDRMAIAIVGSRRCTHYGRAVSARLSKDLADRGLTVVSGLARGIDSAAHAGALDGGGDTVAVLGCGIDHIYPPENARLFQRLHEQGGILSEYPPGTQPLKGHFPGRNRIISGLCRGVLVVEAAQRSGSLITAEFALDQGREVFAVPGAVHTEGSQGVNRLLKDGAHLVTGAEDILAVLRPHLPLAPKPHRAPCSIEPLPEPERTVYDKLGPEPLHIDQLARKCALTPMDLSAILLHLELAGAVQQLPGMYFVRKQNL